MKLVEKTIIVMSSLFFSFGIFAQAQVGIPGGGGAQIQISHEKNCSMTIEDRSSHGTLVGPDFTVHPNEKKVVSYDCDSLPTHYELVSPALLDKQILLINYQLKNPGDTRPATGKTFIFPQDFEAIGSVRSPLNDSVSKTFKDAVGVVSYKSH